MRPLLGILLSALALAGASVMGGVADADATDPPTSLDLRVNGGEMSWNFENWFQLSWEPVALPDPSATVRAVAFDVRNAAGSVVVPETRLPGDVLRINGIHVPAPGRYYAEVWLEDQWGRRWDETSAMLQFDDARPAAARPVAPAGWVSGNAAATVRIEPPAGPLPVSGIRGYAVSVDRGTGSSPCARLDRCSEAEIDLEGGIGGATISLGVLPEGTSVVSAVAVSGSGMRSAQVSSAVLHVDSSRPEVSLAGAPRGWADGPVRLTATASDALSGMEASGPGGPYTAIAVGGGVPTLGPGDSVATTVSGEGEHLVSFYGRDAAGNVGDGLYGQAPSTATVRIDEGAPRVLFAAAQDPSEPERIEATVGDPLSGPDPSRGSISVRPAGSRQPYEPLPTRVAAGRLVAFWDSDSFPQGNYEFRASGYDLAGNATGSDRRAGGARMVLSNPVKTPVEIEAGFGGRRLVWQHCSRDAAGRRCHRETIGPFDGRPATRTVPAGHGIGFGGRLASASGTALAGLPVQIVETFGPGADAAQRISTVHTEADGSFLTRLAPGPDRQVEAVFGGNSLLTRASAGRVRLNALADVRLRASAPTARIGGAPVVFSGRVGDLGAKIPPGGRPVELQFRLPGSAWSEFRTVQTNARGRFRYLYAFSDDDSRDIRFQFRAYAPAQDGWPYEPAASKPVFVLGR